MFIETDIKREQAIGVEKGVRADYKIGYQSSWLTSARCSSSRGMLCETMPRQSPDVFIQSKIHKDGSGRKKLIQTIPGHPLVCEQFTVNGSGYRQSARAMGVS